VDCEVALRRENVGTKQICADIISSTLAIPKSSHRTKVNHSQVLRSIKEKLTNEDLIISKADKGNSVIILDKVSYISKCDNVLEDTSFVILPRDPTDRFQKSVKTALSSCSNLFSDSEKRKLLQMNPLPPRFYGLPKIHKDGTPVRPVVSCIGSPSYKLASKLNIIFRQLSGFSPKYSIKNSIILSQKLQHLTLPPNSKLVSFDVKNLFTSVPVQKTLLLTRDILRDCNIDNSVSSELHCLMELCANQNYFLYNKKFYHQTDGLAMGSPLSPVLAEIFMDNLECQLFDSGHPLLSNIFYWYRYVDDIICCWTGSVRQLDNFLNLLNAQHPNITFTVEIESNKQLNFLDLSISIVGDKHEFGVYRKPCYSDTIIPSDSCHPTSQKLSSFHSMLHRLVNLPLNAVNFNCELSKIKSIAISNGYSVNTITKILQRKLKTRAISQLCSLPLITEKSKKWCRLLFVGDLSNRLARKFPKNKFNVSFYNPCTLGKVLCRNKDKIDPIHQSGIYKVNCDSCNMCYIGQTGRNFLTRMKEHRRCWRNGDETSLLAKHILQTSHCCRFQPEVLHLDNKGIRLDVLEQFEITQSDINILMNEQIFVTQSPLLKIPFPKTNGQTLSSPTS
jgi:hypothetical protein